MINGKELMLLRIKKGLRGKDLAKLIGVSQSYISKMENETRPIPNYIYYKWIKILEGERK